MRGRQVHPDRVASWVASQQLALIGTQQLYVCGIGRSSVARRRHRGVVHPVHQGVFLFGQPIFLPGTRELAAILACGGHVRHRSASALYGLISSPPENLEVMLVGQAGRKRPGIAIHRVTRLDPRDVTDLRGIPIVTAARAILDLAADATGDELERAIAEACARKLTTEAELWRVIARNPLTTGVAALRAELQREGGSAWTRRETERRMKLLVRNAKLPRPVYNRRVVGYNADVFWPAHRLIVEVDGDQFHSSRWAFERDRRRDTAHALAGYTVIRITWRQLTEEPFAVVAIISGALQRSRVRD